MDVLHPFHQFPRQLHRSPGAPDLNPDDARELIATGYPGPFATAHNAVEDRLLRHAGYSEEYQHQEYPRHIVVERDDKGFPLRTVEVASAEEESAVKLTAAKPANASKPKKNPEGSK